MAASVVLAIKGLAEKAREKERANYRSAGAFFFPYNYGRRRDVMIPGDDYSSGGAPDRFGPPGMHISCMHNTGES